MAGRDRTKVSALEKALKAMFKAVESRPVPNRIRSVVDQFEETTPTKGQKKAG